MKKRLLSLALVLAMATSLLACGSKKNDTQAGSESGDSEFDLTAYWAESSDIYADALGEYYAMYQKALEAEDLDTRWALMALSEAKLLESGVMLPLTADGGAFQMSRAAYHTHDFALWGVDMYRFYDTLVATDFITVEDHNALKALYAEKKGTGTYHDAAKAYLEGKGYTLTNEYGYAYSSDPQTWDVLATYRAADFRALVNTYVGLTEYNGEGQQVGVLATSWEKSDDGLTYTFHLRDDAKWYDYQGNEIADVKADDFVAGMQHLLDVQGGLEYLAGAAGANITGADDYVAGNITDFAEVGVKALDDYTLEYTLDAPTSYFLSMLSYSVFAPLCRSYYESLGGVFGVDEYTSAVDAGTYTYGTSYDTIAYNGHYLTTSFAASNQIVFTKNDKFFDSDRVTIDKITWYYNDGSDTTKSYKDALDGTLVGAGLNPSTLELAKNDGNFDKYAYISDTDATTFNSWYNLNRVATSNFNDATIGVTNVTADQMTTSKAALQNAKFRLALSFSIDRAKYNETTVGAEAAAASLRNSYVPFNFVTIQNDVTVSVNGTDTTFPAGTRYGEIIQAQLDADGCPIKAFDATADNGLGSGDGYDGWYNLDNAVKFMSEAIEELAADGVEISAENPVVLELPVFTGSEVYVNRANVMKQCIDSAFDGAVTVSLIELSDIYDWYYAGYYADYGYQDNYDIYDVSGWGPDYGDPATYLNTMRDEDGDMIHLLGIY